MQLLAEVFHRMFDAFDGIFYVPFGILPYFPDGALRLALRAGKGIGAHGQRNLLALVVLSIGHGAIPSHVMTSGSPASWHSC